MSRSIFNKLSARKLQLLCATIVLSLFTAPSMAGSWFKEIFNPDRPTPRSYSWFCPFQQPNGADDWADFSPFSQSTANQPMPSLPSLVKNVTYSFNWDNGKARSSKLRVEVPTMAKISGGGEYDTGGLGNRAVIQALFATFLNRHTPYDADMSIDAGGVLTERNILKPLYSDTVMSSFIAVIEDATGITDGSSGTVEQLAAGLLPGATYYLSCVYDGPATALSSQIYTSTGFMGNIDVSGFTKLLLDGTIMIVQTNKLAWNSSRRAWGYGDDGLYLVKSITRSFSIFGTSYSYTLYDVATGATKVVSPQNEAIRNIWSTGGISGSHTVAMLDDGNPDYAEVITGFAGLDPLVNRF